MNNYVSLFIIITISIFLGNKLYKKCETELEQLLYMIIIGAITAPFIIYYIDKLNLPTKLGWNDNVNTQNWLSFLETYSATMMSAFISAGFMIFTVKIQMDRTSKETFERDKEERRINNMPLLKYSIEDNLSEDIPFNKVKVIPTKFENEYIATFNLKIKNIGMNTLKKCTIKIKSSVLNKPYYCFELDEEQGTLCKDEEKEIQLLLTLKINQKYKFKLEVYYEDLLSNYYMQDLNLNYELTTIFNQNNKCESIKKIIVNNEKKLEEQPILKINLNNNSN